MTNVKAMSLGDVKRAMNPPTSPYDDLTSIIKTIYCGLQAYFPLASKAHTMGLTLEDPITEMSSYLVRDMGAFKARIDALCAQITPDITTVNAMSMGNQLMSLQEDMTTVLEPLAGDLITMYNDRGIALWLMNS